MLGLLHMEIVQERLEREYDLDLIVTAPSVVYKVHMNDGAIVDCDSPAKLCDADKRTKVRVRVRVRVRVSPNPKPNPNPNTNPSPNPNLVRGEEDEIAHVEP